MRVGRTECGFCLTERAFPASIRLTQCEPKTALYCSSGRSSLRAATLSGLRDPRRARRARRGIGGRPAQRRVQGPLEARKIRVLDRARRNASDRIVAYMVAGGRMRFDSDSGAGRVRYRLRLEDGHSSSLIANGVTSAKQRGELSPQHGSLYEWTWDNLSPGPVHVIFCAEGDFDILDRVDVR